MTTTTFSGQSDYATARNLRGRRLILDGNTYGNRDFIKTWNGTWDKANKEWSIPIPGSTKDCATLLYGITSRGMRWAAK